MQGLLFNWKYEKNPLFYTLTVQEIVSLSFSTSAIPTTRKPSIFAQWKNFENPYKNLTYNSPFVRTLTLSVRLKRTFFFLNVFARCTESLWNIQKSGNAQEKVKTYPLNTVVQLFTEIFFYVCRFIYVYVLKKWERRNGKSNFIRT